jgi:hypothetical protein
MSRFWSEKQNAGPHVLDVMRFWDRSPRYLRQRNRERPLPFDDMDDPVRLRASEHSKQVAHFWNAHYAGPDWRMDASEEWVRSILEEPDTTALGVFAGSFLVGTILARPVGRDIQIGLTGKLETAYMIEGLCIHPRWRGRHMAGWLIAWIDYVGNRAGPQAFFWCREVSTALHTTDIALHTYAYLRCSSITEDPLPELRQMHWDKFVGLWRLSSPLWRTKSTIIGATEGPGCRHSLEAWQDTDTGRIAVIANTHRKTMTNEPIMEVVWCGHLTPALNLRGATGDFRDMLEAVAFRHRTTVLFTTDAEHHGGAHAGWPHPWIFGKSGFHSIHIYNYMPPTFWSAVPLFLRSEV